MGKRTHPYAELGLNERQGMFVMVYCSPENNLNASRAYREVYDKDENLNRNTLDVSASQLIRNPKVAKAISLERNKRLANHEELGKSLIQKWSTVVHADVSKAWTRAEIEALPDEVRLCIQGVEPTKEGFRIKWMDKQKAMESLARAIGLNVDIQQQVGEEYVSLIDRLKEEKDG